MGSGRSGDPSTRCSSSLDRVDDRSSVDLVLVFLIVVSLALCTFVVSDTRILCPHEL